MRIVPIACLRDNYAYLLSHEDRACVIDPSEPGPVEQALHARKLKLESIWLTHHHWDHIGGIQALSERFGATRILASAYDAEHGRVPLQSESLSDGDRFEALGVSVRVHHVPGHTLGALAYEVAGGIFTGDTLFLGGCGRLFEGDGAQMHASMQKLGALDPALAVYCGHEYTRANLQFGAHIEPGNAAIKARLTQVEASRDAGRPTVPGTLKEEWSTNVFLRADHHAERMGVSPAEAFTQLRALKDTFRS